MRKSEEETWKQQEEERERLEEEGRRGTEETVRKLAEVERNSERKRRVAMEEKCKREKGPRADEIAKDTVIEVLVSRDGYKLID